MNPIDFASRGGKEKSANSVLFTLMPFGDMREAFLHRDGAIVGGAYRDSDNVWRSRLMPHRTWHTIGDLICDVDRMFAEKEAQKAVVVQLDERPPPAS